MPSYWTSRKKNSDCRAFRYKQSNTGSVKDQSTGPSRRKSSELMELPSINKVRLVKVFSCSNTGSIRDDPYWASRNNSLELMALSV